MNHVFVMRSSKCAKTNEMELQLWQIITKRYSLEQRFSVSASE